MAVIVLNTERLTLRLAEIGDADFLLRLMNEPGWLKFIGDRNIRSLDQARSYIETTLLDTFHQLGFGMYVVERSADGEPVGLCGLVKRDGLEHADLGYALLTEHSGNGYALEAASATLAYGKQQLGIDKIVAITAEDNERSANLLEKLGLRFDKRVRLSPDSSEVLLYT